MWHARPIELDYAINFLAVLKWQIEPNYLAYYDISLEELLLCLSMDERKKFKKQLATTTILIVKAEQII